MASKKEAERQGFKYALAFIPREEAKKDENYTTRILSGMGLLDFSADFVFVPDGKYLIIMGNRTALNQAMHFLD